MAGESSCMLFAFRPSVKLYSIETTTEQFRRRAVQAGSIYHVGKESTFSKFKSKRLPPQTLYPRQGDPKPGSRLPGVGGGTGNAREPLSPNLFDPKLVRPC